MECRSIRAMRAAVDALKPVLHNCSSIDVAEKAHLFNVIETTLATLRQYYNPLHQPAGYCIRVFRTRHTLRDAMVIIRNIEAAIALAAERSEWKKGLIRNV